MTTPLAVVAHRTVPLADLWLEHTGWTNPRQETGLDDDEIAQLGKRIKENGITVPLQVQRINVNGTVRDLVVDGQRRVLAARSAGLAKGTPIPVVDIEESAVDLTPEKVDELMLRALSTLDREGLSSYELSEVALRMKGRGKSGSYIATAIGRHDSWVSKILKARATASPKLTLQWRKGEITDEQFKELAEIKNPEAQAQAGKEIATARKDGDKAEARMRTKEIKEAARAVDRHPEPIADIVPIKPVVKGPQVDLFAGAAPSSPPKPKNPAPSRAVIDDLLGLADKRPPVHDYVKGIMDGVRYAIGALGPEKFGKAWKQYLARIGGTTLKKAKKPKAKARKTSKSKPKRKR